MKNRLLAQNQFLDPSRLAEDAVLALSQLQRGSEANIEMIDAGIRLCDYLMTFWKEPSKDRGAFSSFSESDKNDLTEEGWNLEEVSQKAQGIKEQIAALKASPELFKEYDIDQIKEFLINVTTPIWHKRSSDFRDRKIKRSFIIRG